MNIKLTNAGNARNLNGHFVCHEEFLQLLALEELLYSEKPHIWWGHINCIKESKEQKQGHK